jgi:DNA-binding transcriptional MerR regulator
MDEDTMRIGELARLCGVSTDTLRHYERCGVMPRPPRTRAGYRTYSPEAVARVRTIRGALGIGIGLKQLRAIFAERASGRAPCATVRATVAERIRLVEDEIVQLTAVRDRMRATLDTWNERARHAPKGARLGHLESIAHEG